MKKINRQKVYCIEECFGNQTNSTRITHHVCLWLHNAPETVHALPNQLHRLRKSTLKNVYMIILHSWCTWNADSFVTLAVGAVTVWSALAVVLCVVAANHEETWHIKTQNRRGMQNTTGNITSKTIPAWSRHFGYLHNSGIRFSEAQVITSETYTGSHRRHSILSLLGPRTFPHGILSRSEPI